MIRYSVLFLVAGLIASTLYSGTNESRFFNDTIGKVSKSVDLVRDFGANGQDAKDDSQALQKAIDQLASLPGGGKITIPEGTYHLMDIVMKSNIHIVIDTAATIVPANPSGMVFRFGADRKGAKALVQVNNASIRGKGGRYTVDFRSGKVMEKLAFANCRNVDNFMIADFEVLDNYTRLSSVTLNLAQHEDQFFRARNGVIKNGDVVNAHVGYGLIQMQLGYNILFKDLSGQGGVTLRLESGAVADSPPEINIDEIYARNISNRDGSSAFIMGAHTKIHGKVDIDGVTTYGSCFGGGIGRGFATPDQAARGHTGGHFSADSIVKNVHAVFGTNGTVKSKNFYLIPEPLKKYLSKEKSPDTVSFKSPSIAAIKYSDPNITLMNVTAEGFEHQPIPVVINRKKVTDPETLAKLEAYLRDRKWE
ncbi:MAG: glycosyl hydrolase family 28-related protein [Puniceicoccaceae bacterium]